MTAPLVVTLELSQYDARLLRYRLEREIKLTLIQLQEKGVSLQQDPDAKSTIRRYRRMIYRLEEQLSELEDNDVDDAA